MPCPPGNEIRPAMLPVDGAKLGFGYRAEIPAMSSAVSGEYSELARPAASVDIALAVNVCCNPNAWPISWTTVWKNSSVKLGDVQTWLLRLRFSRIVGRVIATKLPPGAKAFLALVAVKPSVSGSISSNTTSTPGVVCGVLDDARPPNATRTSEVS